MDTLPIEPLANDLARLAHRLGLDGNGLEAAEAETVREFAELVLQELAARGLVAGPEEIGCWAAQRQRLNSLNSNTAPRGAAYREPMLGRQ